MRVNKDAAEMVGFVFGILLGFWVVGYLFHLRPLPTTSAVWWAIPWLATVISVGVCMILLGVCAGSLIAKLLNK